MSEQYTISAVSTQTRDYESNGKAKRVYYVKLNEAQPKDGVQAFELHQLQSSKPPEAGHRIDVKTFQEGEFNGSPFVKIVKDFSAGRGGGSGPQGSDERVESIERQVAAKVAGGMAMATPPGSTGAVAMLANFEGFFDSVLQKIQGTPQAAPQQPLNGGGGEVPVDTAGLQPAAPATADSEFGF